MFDLVVHSGVVLDVVGRCRRGSRFAFVPVTADGNYSLTEPLPHALSTHLNGRTPPALERFHHDWHVGYASWVRARLPPVFDFAPPGAAKSHPKQSLLDCSFAAIPIAKPKKQTKAYLFCCTDNEDLQVGLAFFEPQPSDDVAELIAHDFWELLLREPATLLDFVDYVLLGADIDRSPCRVSWLHGAYNVEQVGEAIG